MSKSARVNHVNANSIWASKYLDELLHQWLKVANNQSGTFRPHFGRDWTPIENDQPIILVSQARLIYTMAIGCELTGDSVFADATRQGIESLESQFRIGPEPHYCWSLTANGVHDITDINSYGYAFVVLALSTAARSQMSPDYADRAFAAWNYMQHQVSDEYGALNWHRPVPRPGIPEDAKSQNPLMHSFEALMTLARVNSASPDTKSEALTEAERIYTFVRSLSGFSSGKFVEWYTTDWIPQPVDAGGHIELGHSFEWAVLLSDWFDLTGDDEALSIGINFINTAISWGLTSNGLTHAICKPGGEVASSYHGLWQQCEAVRAISRYSRIHDQPAAKAAIAVTLQGYRDWFVDPDYPGVFAGPVEGGNLVSTNKGDSWKLDYHSVNMLLEIAK